MELMELSREEKELILQYRQRSEEIKDMIAGALNIKRKKPHIISMEVYKKEEAHKRI